MNTIILFLICCAVTVPVGIGLLWWASKADDNITKDDDDREGEQ